MIDPENGCDVTLGHKPDMAGMSDFNVTHLWMLIDKLADFIKENKVIGKVTIQSPEYKEPSQDIWP